MILDGLQDLRHAQRLSEAWAEAGYLNAVDSAGQWAWVARAAGDRGGELGALTEVDMGRVAGIARRFGLELRDRVGEAFRADNDLAGLRRRMVYEYKSRFATAVVFGLPALGLHYWGPVLAGGGRAPGAMVYPWLLEMLLTGWACVAGGWPILWQGALAARYLRATGDLLTSAIVLGAFVPSAVGVLSLAGVERPWFEAEWAGGGPAFHAAVLALWLAVLQRWLVHAAGDRLSGRSGLMIARFGGLVWVWLLLSVAVGAVGGWGWGLSVGILLPPLASLGAVHPWAPGWSAVLPVFGFAAVLLLGPGALGLRLAGAQVEVAGGFAAMMVAVFAVGWARFVRAEARGAADAADPVT